MELDSNIFSAPVRPDLMHSVVVAQAAGKRAGTAATKNRALVSGGNSKPYRQKGTGRARQGSTRSPQFAGGGIVFGPQPRSYEQKLPKKLRRAALRSALSLRNKEQRLHVADSLEISELKTKRVVELIGRLGVEQDVLLVTAERDIKLERAARNLPKVRVLPVVGLNVRDVLARAHVVLTREAVAAISERLR
jgi:large subunit ribosomal protein L4